MMAKFAKKEYDGLFGMSISYSFENSRIEAIFKNYERLNLSYQEYKQHHGAIYSEVARAAGLDANLLL